MIRDATKYDVPVLVEMMRRYAAQSPIAALGDQDFHDPAHVAKLMEMMIAGRGFVLIDSEHRGFLAAIVMGNVWCPKVYELRELAWWVDAEHRNGIVGGRLWCEFRRRADNMIVDGRITYVCTSKLSNSPAINFTKQGYALLETTYFKE
jgi:N-acetylglutamate synthase-like GNAT family acetyltransferase